MVGSSVCVDKGYGNYKPFIIFIMHAAIGSIYALILCGSVVVLLSLSTSTLLGWHIYLLTHNMSTGEYREVVRAMWLARKSGQKYRHPYDISAYNNLVLILGPNVLKWDCPVAVGHLDDGTQFPISND